ncbi:hypothetical protein N0V84_004055 [Fusarium piperis]|uniref:Nephrocystin 3-like N-terminal domain-containing protein n=1 Tax=Fusarium piperis TaxID=1435070 RepID=A0A9W9BRX0_9HYPO|nr:hypothetical protein N0V84_004055 [Fusarium piperis]
MDPLSITTALVASLQVASSILSHCYSVRTEMRKMPGTLIQIIDEVRALRNLMETVESILDKNETSDQKGTSETPTDNIKRVIATCLTELQTVERRIRPVDVEAILGSTRKTLLQTLTWRLKGDEAKESILGLQRCKASLNLAITCHNSVKVENIERLSISLSAKMDESYGRLNELSTDVGTAQLNIPVCAFMYCNFRNPDSQDLVKVMGAILGQMCTQMKTFPQELQNSYRISTEQGWGQPPTLDMISNMIRVLSTKQRAFLFVDGMDEVGDPKALVEILVSLPDSSSWLNILLSSRNDVDIQRALSNVRRLSLEHHVLEIDRDIGRFQWAACQLDSLSHCRTIKDIKESLKRLPQGLGETYAKLLVPSSPMDVALHSLDP